jgi:hypothetical protein
MKSDGILANITRVGYICVEVALREESSVTSMDTYGRVQKVRT